MSKNRQLKIVCLTLLVLTGIITCKKDEAVPEEIVSPTTGTRRQFTLDSIFLYARQVYLWNTVMPGYSTFNPRNKYATLSPDLTAFQTELFDISQMKLNPLTNLAYEYPLQMGRPKYSYMENGVTGRGGIATTATVTAPNPVLITTVLTAGTTTVGYIALSSFSNLSTARPDLDAAFAQLAAAKPAELIVDLRNNGGGYVETAEYVANLIATSTLNGKTIYVEQFNSQMQQDKALILRHQPYLDDKGKPVMFNGRPATMADVDYTEIGNTYKFNKKGNLETVKNVYFIVSGNTASASELLINCLKPYFEVKLAGSKTYGKPVGFFGLVIDRYTVYMSSFLIKNALGFSDYFDGIPVDIPVEPDGKYALGDPNEACLSRVLSYILQTKNITRKSVQLLSGLKSTKTIVKKDIAISTDDSVPLNGMIEHRRKLKGP